MQLLLIFGIAFAIGAVAFALQNNVPVTVNFFVWSFDGSLAMVLLFAIGVGAVIAGLVSSPTVIKGQWKTVRLRRQVADLERDKADQAQRISALEAELKRADPQAEVAAEPPKPYVGLKTLLTTGGKSETESSA